MMSPMAPSRTTRMRLLAGLAAVNMLHQLPGPAVAADRMFPFHARVFHGFEGLNEPVQAAIVRNHHVVYHAQCGHQLSARERRENLVAEGQNDYQEGMVAHPGKLAGDADAEHVEVARNKGDGRREFERGGDAQDFASGVHSWRATAATLSDR